MTDQEAHLSLMLQGWIYEKETESSFAQFTRGEYKHEKITVFIDTLGSYNGDAPGTSNYSDDMKEVKNVSNSIGECVMWLDDNNI